MSTKDEALEALIEAYKQRFYIEGRGLVGPIDPEVHAAIAALSSPSSTVMDEKGEREKFEAWGCDTFNYGFNPETWGERDPGEYAHEGTQMAFEGWLARAALTAPAPSAAEPVAPGWTSQEIIEACDAAGIDDRAFRRLMSALKVLDKRTRAPALPRPDDDALWDKTLKERDDYHEWADQLAARISSITGVDIGEHSSANNPWQKALNAADEFSYGPPPEESLTAPAPSAAEPVALEACKKFIDSFSILDDGPDESDVVHAQCLMVEAIKLARSAIAAPPASAPSAAEPVSITDEQIVAALEKAEHDYNFPRYGNSKGDWVSIGQRRTVAVFRSLLAAPPAPQPTEAGPVTCGNGCHCLAQCGDTYEHSGTAKPPKAEAPVAEPVAWANFRHDPPSYVPFRTREEAERSVARSEIAATQEGPYTVVGLVPVGTHPAPSAAEDAKDAKRWRHLRDSGSDGKGGLLMLVHAVTEGEHLPQITCEAVDYDKTIDAAMAKEKQ